jgi:hypothetical protein
MTIFDDDAQIVPTAVASVVVGVVVEETYDVVAAV